MMNTKLPAGDYLVEGYNAEGQCNGSLVLTVKANQDNVFTLNRAYEIYATNDSYSWVEGTDYSIDVTVTAADGTDLQAKTGVSTTYGNTRTSCLFLEGGSLSITLTPWARRPRPICLSPPPCPASRPWTAAPRASACPSPRPWT